MARQNSFWVRPRGRELKSKKALRVDSSGLLVPVKSLPDDGTRVTGFTVATEGFHGVVGQGRTVVHAVVLGDGLEEHEVDLPISEVYEYTVVR